MEEDNKKEEAPFETYAERLQKVKSEAKQPIFSKKEKSFKTSQAESEIAQMLMRLSTNEDFQTYLQFENEEISKLCVNGFNPPPQGLMDGSSFGEQMAFNKGRLYQMNQIRGRRDSIIKIYLEVLKKQKGA